MSESFSWLSLDSDEEVVWSGRPRLHVLLWVVASGLAVPALLLIVWPTPLSAALGVLVLVAITAIGYFYVTNIDYVVSTKYVYSKWGVLGRSVTQIALQNIQDTTLSQGIFGTQSDYGTVSFSTAGGEGSTLAFYLVDEPSTVKSAVDR
ncbi:PH domain-containing protein [Halostagnicola sp. A-GB9-2]|uniref:PH domain-containing protein n=1 Tax=Halostagnicola sp. A-GB9-2 TaxID=3048066 RepID=UPI0024C07A80|nr:PH domain-containing protein [Halostagnicola sp. A-GB9-2]MDJ1434496.1 PH domain-containing protein [Halostagnicola sp. A-GB9-2]